MIELKRSGASRAADLAKMRAAGVAEITSITDTVRRKFVTAITGQDMIYLEKEREAISFVGLTRSPADLSEFPFLAADVSATGLDVYQVAQIILFKSARWRAVGSEIEGYRIAAMSEIEVALTRDDVVGVVASYRASLVMVS